MILFWLIVLFVTVPLAELALLIWVGGKIGVMTTIAIVVVTGILGATLARLEGLATWRRFQQRLASGELPHEDLVDGLLILIAGAVLLTPGLLTDVAGFLLLVPQARAVIRGAIAARLANRFVLGSPPGGARAPQPPPRRSGPSDDVVDAEYTVEDGMISDPIALLGTLFAVAALAFWLEGHFGWAQKAGASLLIIVFGAVLSNLNLVPVSSPVYDAILGPVTSLAIVWLLLSVNLRDVVKAGPRMLLAFGVAVVATMVGALAAVLFFGDAFPGDAWRIAGALTGTYAGGSVNFVAIGREVGLTDSLFAATAAADNLVTAVWVGATLILPIWLKRFYPARQPAVSPEAGAGGMGGGPLDILSARLRDLLTLAALAAGLLIAAGWIGRLTPAIPTVLWLTTLALAAGQVRAVQALQGSFQLGLLALNLFFAIIGIGSRVSEILAVGLEVLYFTATVVLVHGLLVYGAGRLLRLDVETLSVASQAAVGGPSSALALTTARGWRRLALPGVLVGLLGYAVGNYAGLAIAALLR